MHPRETDKLGEAQKKETTEHKPDPLRKEIRTLRSVSAKLQDQAKDFQSVALDITVHINYGLIPLLKDLQGTHPDFAPSSVKSAIQRLRNHLKRIGELTDEE